MIYASTSASRSLGRIATTSLPLLFAWGCSSASAPGSDRTSQAVEGAAPSAKTAPLAAKIAASVPPDGQWHVVRQHPLGLNGALQAGDLTVAVGDLGEVWTSTDGASWAHHFTGTGAALQAVARGASGFVAVGANGTVARSSDGLTWSSGASGTQAYLKDVVWTGARYVALGFDYPNTPWGIVMTSPDGVTWTRVALPTGVVGTKLAWSGSRLVVVGWDNGSNANTYAHAAAAVSLDGVTWTRSSVQMNDPASDQMLTDVQDVVWAGTQFVAIEAEHSLVLTSRDGTSWTGTTRVGTGSQAPNLAYSGNRVLAHADLYAYVSSDHGATWTQTSNSTSEAGDVVSGGNLVWTGSRFLEFGSGEILTTADDGATWQSVSFGTTPGDITRAAASPSEIVVRGGAFCLLRTTDGVSWSGGPCSGSDLNPILWDGARFVTLYEGTSPDGVSWTAPPARPTYLGGSALAAFGGRYYAITNKYDHRKFHRPAMVWSSSDGLTWSSQDLAVPFAGSALAVSPSALVSAYTNTASTVDGTTWTAGADAAHAVTDMIWTGTELLATGEQGEILASADGRAWTARASGTTVKLWTVAASTTDTRAAGEAGTVLVSPDRVAWTAEAPFTQRAIYKLLYAGGAWFAFGQGGLVAIQR